MKAESTRMTGWKRIASGALVAAVLTVQFGLLLHEIEAGPAHADAACDYCIAGAHDLPVIDGTVDPSHARLALSLSATRAPAVVATSADAHRVRGPPLTA